MKKSKRKNPEFVISEHAKERFAERFPRKITAHAGDVDSAIVNELNISRKSGKKTTFKQNVKYNGMEVSHYLTNYAVFVVGLDNTVITAFPRDGTNFDNAKAWKKRRIDTERRIAKRNGEPWDGNIHLRKPRTRKYIPMNLVRVVRG